MPKLQFKPVANLPNVFSAPDYIIERNGDRPGKPWRAPAYTPSCARRVALARRASPVNCRYYYFPNACFKCTGQFSML